MSEEKKYFSPGDVVILKQDIPNKPVMVVKFIQRAYANANNEEPVALLDRTKLNLISGVVCFWFTKDNAYQEKLFNFKDLQPYVTVHSN